MQCGNDNVKSHVLLSICQTASEIGRVLLGASGLAGSLTLVAFVGLDDLKGVIVRVDDCPVSMPGPERGVTLHRPGDCLTKVITNNTN